MIENTLHHILGRVITEGNFRVIYPSGRTEQYGNGAGKPLAIRITDKAALRAIVLDPGLKAPEMYMDGRLVIEEGDIYDSSPSPRPTPAPRSSPPARGSSTSAAASPTRRSPMRSG